MTSLASCFFWLHHQQFFSKLVLKDQLTSFDQRASVQRDRAIQTFKANMDCCKPVWQLYFLKTYLIKKQGPKIVCNEDEFPLVWINKVILSYVFNFDLYIYEPPNFLWATYLLCTPLPSFGHKVKNYTLHFTQFFV